MGDNEYKISLGVDLDTSDLREQINKIDSKHNVKLGVDLAVNDIRDRISQYNKNSNNAKLKLGIKLDTDDLKKQINSLNLGGTTNGKGVAIPVNTQSLETSLREVKGIISDIKTSIGSLDSGAGMKSLLSSINQISTALDKASGKFDELNAELKVLSSKDFSINLGIDMGKKNLSTIGYGRAARKQVIPQLEEQAKYLEDLLGGQQDVVKKLAKHGNGIGFDIFSDFNDFNSDSAIKKMEAMEKYVNSMKKIAAIDNVDLSGFNSQFSKSASEMINDITGVENAVDKAEDTMQKFKNLFGGSNIDAEGLTAQLNSIVTDLGEIKTTIQGLSSGVSIDGLTQSFDRLSDSIELLVKNCTTAKQAINDTVGGLGGSTGGTDSGVKNLNNDLKQVTVTAENTADVLKNMREALSSMKFNSTSIDAITSDLEEMGVAISKISVKDNGVNLDVTVKGVDSVGRAVTEVRRLNAETNEISTVSKSISQSFDREAKEVQETLKELKNIATQMGKLETDIFKLDGNSNANEIEVLENQLNSLRVTYEKLWSTININDPNLQIGDFKKLDSVFEKTENKLAQLKAKMADTSALKETNEELKELESLAKQIGSLEVKIKGLDGNKNANEVAELTSELKRLQDTYDKLISSFNVNNPNINLGDIANIDNIFAETENKLKQLDAKFADTKAKLANDIKIDIELGNVENEMDTMRTKYNNLSNANTELRVSVEKVENAYESMLAAAKADTGNIEADRERLIQAEKEYAAALERTNNLIKKQARLDSIEQANEKLANSHKSLELDMVNWLKNNTKAAKEYGDQIEQLIILLNKLEQSGNLKQIDINSGRSTFNLLTKDAERRGLTGLTAWDRLVSKVKEYSVYLSAADVFMYASQGLKDMFEQVKLIDSAMTELKKVTDESDAAYNRFLSNAGSRAKEIGTTIDGLVTSTADFARLGYGFSESQKLAEVANIYAVVGDEIDGVETATKSLISTMTAFGIESSNSMSIVDKFNEIGNNFAISSGGIGEALERSASSMAAANNSLDETIALITAANTVVQDPEQVGTAFKTISMRIRGAKTQLEEAGLDAEGMASSTAKLREEIKALSGVDIMLDNTTFKSTYQIMEELANKWQDLTDIQQASITELIAGKRQGNIVSSLMTNFDIAQSALQTSLDSSGSAMEEHEKYMNSIEAKLSQLKAAWQSFAQAFMDSDFLKGGIDALKGLVEVLEWLVDNFGLLGTIGLGAGITGFFKHFKGVKEAKKTLNDVVNAIDNVANKMLNATKSASNFASATSEVAEAGANMASVATEAAEATSNLASASTEATETTANLIGAASESAESITNMTSAATEGTESMTNFASTVTEVTESSANMASTITESTEAMANMASTATEAAESSLNVVSASTEIAESAGNVASASTEMIEAGANVTSLVATVGETAVKSSGGLGKLAGGLGKTVASASKFIGIAGLVVAGLALVYNQIKKNKEAAAEERQEIIESSNAYLDAASNFEQAYIKYSGRTDLTATEEADLESAIQGTIEALGDKDSALKNIVNSSGDYLASIERIADAEIRENARVAEDKRKNAQTELEEIAMGWARWDGSEVNIGIGIGDSEAASIAEKMNSKFVTYEKPDSSSERAPINNMQLYLPKDADVNQIIEYYDFLLAYKKELSDAELTDTTTFERVNDVIGKLSETISVYTDGVYEAAKAQYQLDSGIPKTVEEYIKMREAILNSENINDKSFDTKMSIANSLDSEYGKAFDLSDVKAQARKFVGIIKNYGDSTKDGIDEIGTVETFLNMRTAVNNNECTVGDYLSQFDKINDLTKEFDDKEKEEFNLAFGLDTDSIKEQYENVYNYLSRNYLNKDIRNMDRDEAYYYKLDVREYQKQIEGFLNNLSASELSALVSIKGEIDWENASTEDILKQIQDEAKLQEALRFEANIEADTTALEKMNEILTESASAMGLSSEAIESLQAKYSDLDGYDPSTLFERTANGVKVNREELEKLEKKQNDLTKSKIKEHLDTLVNEYNDVTAEIDKCTNAGERAELLSKREGYKDKIEELATYQAQLEGVTGAYQDWINAQNAPEDYEGYEAVATGREDIEDEIDRGFIGNSTKKYIDLLSGEDLDGKSVDDYADAWEKLDDKVTKTGYSVNDFFTVNDDGDITAKGIDRFMKSVKEEFDDIYDSDTGIYDFSQKNLEKIQKEWGIGIEAIQLLLEAAVSAGYEVDWGGVLDGIDLDTSSFETLVSAAEAAQTAYNKIEGLEDVHFNFTATGVKEAETEIEKARQAFSKFINEDGTVNIKADGAEEMQFILTTLIIQKQQLSTPAIMKVDTSQIDQAETKIIDVINKAQTLQSAYENYEIAISTGVDVEGAKKDLNSAITALEGTDANIRADLKLPTNEDLQAAAGSLGDIKVGATLDGTAIGSIATKIQTECTPEIIAKVTGIDESAITNGEGGRQVKYTPEHSAVDAYINGLTDINKKIIFKYTTEGTKPNPSNIERTITYKYTTEGTSPAAGTAHAGGTTGRAFARGNWGIGGNGVALGGELGQELIVRDGKFFTIGDKGAEFFHYRHNDIIFNAAQTESLFKYGGIRGAKPRGTMLAGGTAFANGRAYPWSATGKESGFVKNRVTGESYGSKDAEKSKDKDFEGVIDWIEVILDRVQRSIDKFDQQANNIYKNWSSRNNALLNQISEVNKEISLQQQAKSKYMDAANGVGLSSDWAEKVRNGEIDIDTIKDEALADKIKSYQDYYEKALDCEDAIRELREEESKLYKQRFDNVATQYEGALSIIEHEKNMLEEYISQSEAQAWLVSSKYYDALAKNERENISKLKEEKNALLSSFNSAMNSGTIDKYSEAWYEMVNAVDEVTLAITESETALKEYQQTLSQLKWEQFDLLQDRISSVTEETEFLIELLSSDKLYDDRGQLTNEGKATMGLHGTAYNTYMYQSEKAAAEVERLKKELAKDPYDTDLETRYREMIALQQEYILNAQDQKEAIRDMVEEGIEYELDALQELIDKYNDALDSEKD